MLSNLQHAIGTSDSIGLARRKPCPETRKDKIERCRSEFRRRPRRGGTATPTRAPRADFGIMHEVIKDVAHRPNRGGQTNPVPLLLPSYPADRFAIVDFDPFTTDPSSLVSLFFPSCEAVGRFEAIAHQDTPPPFQQLLSHDHHMTVTLESFLNMPVTVSVLAVNRQGSIYSRNSLLHRQSDGMPVQFGIVRLHLHLLEPHIRAPIEEERTPLGRILIQHEILREVELSQVYRVACGPKLAEGLRAAPGQITYGRTALIHCHAEPAVELLEIVAPFRPSESSSE